MSLCIIYYGSELQHARLPAGNRVEIRTCSNRSCFVHFLSLSFFLSFILGDITNTLRRKTRGYEEQKNGVAIAKNE